MPGYTCAICENGMKSFDPKYLCTSCRKVLRDPVQTSCGHRYCKSCIEPLLSVSSSIKCLADSEEINKEKMFEDKFARREILSLPVQCTNHCDGCNWRGELGQLEEHESQCPYAKVQCMHPSCGVLVLRDDLSRHLVEECSFREQQCQYCDMTITVDKIKQHQENECQEYDIDCPDFSSHLDPVNGDCEATEAPCPFHELGCAYGKTMKRKENRDHQDKQTTDHLNRLLLFVQQLSNFFYSKLDDDETSEKSKVITNMDKTIKSLLDKVDAILNENSNVTSMLQGHGTRISNLEQSIKRFLMDDVVPDSAPLNSSLHRSSQAETNRILQGWTIWTLRQLIMKFFS
ncbi:hypothetical protein OS493_005730 [Desmophyllum pertusum]|uniref:Uncharacterized protein n=1 Tax=Desmophyllum pertusum TaxID=174260 RepID=A0A9X0CFR5_9CNID|nr:hypothetical protein OS493_005730 [Desmophyllum pertusum]